MFPRKTRLPVSRLVLAALLLAGATGLSRSAAASQPVILQAAPERGFTAMDFAGTWHWLFQGKPFVTMSLVSDGGQFAGSISNAAIDADANGRITSAVATAGSAPIVRTALERGILRIVTRDGQDETEWAMTLTSSTTAEVRPSGPQAHRNLEAIRTEKMP